MLTHLLVAAYFVEAGLLLIVAPWTTWWERNFFADLLPWLDTLMASTGTRLAVGFIGLVTAVAGVGDFRMLLFGDHRRRRPPDDP